jgi:electron transport complex protein RnfB
MRPVREDAIDRVLPQTQCTKCGYPACRPYARAIAAGEADINRCPPGGDAGVRTLAALTGRAYTRLDPACGVEAPRRTAVIDERRCIGCSLCILACPVDAIIGARKQMHTVITELCTGCDLCVAPCPVDCIEMVLAAGTDAAWDASRADAARERCDRRQARLARDRGERAVRLAARAPRTVASPAAKRAAIDAALGRARARRAAHAKR